MAFIGNQPTAVPLTSSQLADGLITTDKLAADAVTSAKIADGAIVNVDVNSTAAVAYSKLNLATSIVNADISASAAIATTKLGAGAVLQVVSVSESNIFYTSSTSYVDVTTMSISITPSSASNKILIMFFGQGTTSGGDTGHIRLNKDGTALFIGTTSSSRQSATVGISNGSGLSNLSNLSFSYLDSPSTTSSTNYKITMRANTGTAYLGRTQVDGDASGYPRTPISFTLMEIKG